MTTTAAARDTVTIDRVLRATTDTLQGVNNYRAQSERAICDTVAEATLVTSELGHFPFDAHLQMLDPHAPALDIDFPAKLLRDDAGRSWLHLARPASHRRNGRALAALHRAGIAAVSQPPVGRLWHDQQAEAAGALTRELADGFDGTFGELVDTARLLAKSEPLRSRPAELGEGLLVPLACDALLVASSSLQHHHLYFEVLLEWNDYSRLLDRLARAGILERGYAGASKARGHTALRRPGKLKPSPPPDDTVTF